MKKLSILLIGLLLISGLAFAQTSISISGSSTLEWGFKGQLLDNTAEFAGVDVPGFYTDDSGAHKWGPKEVKLTMSAADEDGVVIVRAESKLTLHNADKLVPIDTNLNDVFEFIEFPNVVPGVLGILLNKNTALETGVTTAKSVTTAPHIVITATPIEGLTAKVGLSTFIGGLKSELYTAAAPTTTTTTTVQTITITAEQAADFADVSEFDVDGIELIYNLTESEPASPADPITAGDVWLVEVTTTTTTPGAVTAGVSYTSGTYVSFATSLFVEYKLALGEEDSVTASFGTIIDTAYLNSKYNTKAASTPFAGGDQNVEAWGPKVIVAKDATPNATLNETKGFATFPIGLGLKANMMGITAGVDFRTRLVQGVDVADVDAAGVIRDGFALPLYAAVNVSYPVELDGITITPSANFRYSSDFWKWGLNTAGDNFEYKGLVSAAEFIGRPMSAGVNVNVTGIADILDVKTGFSMGFGDGEYAHGLDSEAYELTKLLQDQIDAEGTPTTGSNDGFFATASPLAMRVTGGLAVTPVEGVKITNDSTYTVDNLGFLGRKDGTRYGNWLSQFKNDTTATYAIMVGESAAASLFGKLNWTTNNFVRQQGTVYDENFVPTSTEQGSKSTLGYSIGVSVKVSF